MSNKQRSSGIASDIVAFFKGRGYTNAQARGIAAGIHAESANDHNVRGGYKGRAVGLGQWLGPRRQKLLTRYGPNPTRQQQLEFLDYELRGGDPGGKMVLAHDDEGKVLDAYIKKFMRPAPGSQTEGDMRRGMSALGKPYTGKPKYTKEVSPGVSVATTDLKDIDLDELIHSTPDELFAEGRRPLRPERAPKGPDKKERVFDILTGGKGLSPTPERDMTGVHLERQLEQDQQIDEAGRRSHTFVDRAAAAINETWIIPQMIDALRDDEGDFDPAFMREYRNNWQTIEAFAQNDDEVDQLREATNGRHLELIKERIVERRENNRVIDSNDTGLAFRLGAGFTDPAGWAAGLGIGKAAQVAGVGSFQLARQGSYAGAAFSSSVEGMVGNVAIDAALDASGQYVSAEQYSLSALTGAAIGLAASPLIIKGGADTALEDRIADAIVAQEEQLRNLETVARTKLGPDASPEAVAAEVNSTWLDEQRKAIDYALADIPEDHRLLISNEVATADALVKKQQVEGNDLGSISDAVERNMVAEISARSEQIVATNPINTKNLKSMLEWGGLESPAMRLLKSDSAVARATALTLLENPSGAGGRRRTAAIVQATRERMYNEALSGYDVLSEQFRRMEGVSRAKDFWDGDARNGFNDRVFYELEQRMNTPEGTTFDPSPIVQRAADLFERGMNLMRMEQQKVDVVGAIRLGDSSRGYVPHRLDPRAVMGLTGKQQAAVRSVLSDQFQSIEGFDKKFSNKLAAKYLERAIDGANGRYHVPFNLYSPEAGQMIRDAMKGMGLDAEDIDKAMGKFSRGGSGHTKRRLRLDLSADIGDGKKLGDLFVKDIPTLFRAYARRVSGEVALAQFGVMGKKGLQLMSKAITETGGTPQDIEAFDQIAAEFLNTPFGQANWKWMDNLRTMTSAARLGGMGFTQFAEFANAIPALGLRHAMKGVAGMPQMLSKVRAIANGSNTPDPILQSIDKMGGHLGMEDYTMTRLFDVKDNSIELYNGESMDVLTRAIRGTGNQMMVLSGHRVIMATQTRLMAEMVLRKAVSFAQRGDNDVALRDMGFSDNLINALRNDLDNIATFKKGELESLDLFKGKHLTKPQIAELVQAVERGSAQIIQRTFTGEVGKWAHNGFLKMLFQFRTFSLTALEKQWGRNVNNYQAMGAAMRLLAVMPFAMAVHFARVQGKMLGMSEDQREEYADKYLSLPALTRATLNYTAASGLAGDVLDLGAGFASEWGGDWGEKLGTDMNVRGGTGQLVGGVVAPGVGYMQDVWKGIHGDGRAAVRAIPGANLPYVVPFLNALRGED